MGQEQALHALQLNKERGERAVERKASTKCWTGIVKGPGELTILTLLPIYLHESETWGKKTRNIICPNQAESLWAIGDFMYLYICYSRPFHRQAIEHPQQLPEQRAPGTQSVSHLGGLWTSHSPFITGKYLWHKGYRKWQEAIPSFSFDHTLSAYSLLLLEQRMATNVTKCMSDGLLI